MDARASSILDFWFGPPGTDGVAHSAVWWKKEPRFDAEIRERFGPLLEEGSRGGLDHWGRESDPRSSLALVVLLDQFSRNAFRDTPRMFAQDGRALAVCLDGLERELDHSLSFLERYVFQMPLMHAEDRRVQHRSIEAFFQLVEDAREAGAPMAVQGALRTAHDFAVRHARIVERFGRFPHRNAILGRATTPEEAEFLKEPESGF